MKTSLILVLTITVALLHSSFSASGAPLNDIFENRSSVVGLTNSASVSNIFATKEVGEPNHFGNIGGKSVWWTWSPTTNGLVTMDTIGSTFDTLLAVYLGSSVSNLTHLASDDDSAGSLRSRVTFPGIVGTTYQIAVDGYNGGGGAAEGNITLNVSSTPPLAEPSNNEFVNRITISSSSNSVSGYNAGASIESGEPNHFSSGGKSVWWSWTPATNGTVTIDTIGSSFDTLLAVYWGSFVSSLTYLASDDDSAGSLRSRVTFPGIAGTTYQIAVDGYNGGEGAAEGNITLNFNSVPLPAEPPNDAFTNRISVFGLTNSVAGYNLGATKEAGEPNHAGFFGGYSVWWTWTAPTNGVFTADTAGSSFDTVMAVYTGSVVSNLAEVASTDDDFFHPLSFVAVAGVPYQIAVDGENGGGGTINLHLTYVGIPQPNDNFADATPITGTSNYLSGSTVNTTIEPGEPGVSPGTRQSAWWYFDAPTNGTVRIQKDDRYVPILSVYAGNNLSNLSFVANGGGSTTWECTFSFGVTAGVRYYVRAAYPPSTFQFQFVFQPAPPNDPFASRFVLEPSVQRAVGTIAGATRELGEPAPGGDFISAWWSWTPTNNGPVILTTSGSKADTQLAVYTGSVLSNLTLNAYNDFAYAWLGVNGPPVDTASRLRLDAVAGTEYQIAVTGTAGEVVLNFESLAIESITSLSRTLQTNRSVDFSADLLLTNLRTSETAPLRVRVLARPWYISRNGVFFPCPEAWPIFDAPDQQLGVFALSAPDSLSPINSRVLNINGTVPPPFENGAWGFGYGVLAVLEEQAGDFWIPQDTRMIVLGDWANVGGFPGPGGGVLLIVPTQSATSGAGYLQVHIAPEAARQAGAAWRLQGETVFRTNQNSTAQITTNGPVVIEFASVPGWNLPQSQTANLPVEQLTIVNVSYSPIPPTMAYTPSTGFGITGTTNTKYRIEYRTNLMSGAWLPLQTNTITATGFNFVLPWPPTNGVQEIYYRAKWLP